MLGEEARGRIRGDQRDRGPVDEPRRRVELDATKRQVEQADTWQRWLLWALIGQVAVVHLVFVGYLVFLARRGEVIEPNVFIAYLGVTLGETVGLAAVVVRHLFPRGA